jgi:hypothetical protein
LLDLVVGDPGGAGAPRRDVVLGDLSSGSTLSLTASFQRSVRAAPFIGFARTSGAMMVARRLRR